MEVCSFAIEIFVIFCISFLKLALLSLCRVLWNCENQIQPSMQLRTMLTVISGRFHQQPFHE